MAFFLLKYQKHSFEPDFDHGSLIP